jgi:hypothetical protein
MRPSAIDTANDAANCAKLIVAAAWPAYMLVSNSFIFSTSVFLYYLYLSGRLAAAMFLFTG